MFFGIFCKKHVFILKNTKNNLKNIKNDKKNLKIAKKTLILHVNKCKSLYIKTATFFL